MGKVSSSGAEQAGLVVAGTFTASSQTSSTGVNLNGQTVPAMFFGDFVVTARGSGTVQLERSYDGGQNYDVVAYDGKGDLAVFVISASQPLAVIATEPERGVLHRLNCTAFTSTITYRLAMTDKQWA